MSRLYLDACCIIYLVEGTGQLHEQVKQRVLRHQGVPAARLVTSRLSRLECRVKPLREAKTALLAEYELVFQAARFELAELDDDVVEKATELRARHGFKTPDALHLATAIVQRADAFLTGDTTLARCTDVKVELVSST